MKFYPFHSGSLSSDLYKKASDEIYNKIKKFCTLKKIECPKIQTYQINNKNLKRYESFSLVKAYSEELLKFVKRNRKSIVLDADLAKDAGSSEVMLKISKQFIEFGIAEQDMVSFGSGLAAKNFLPIFHSFSCFLSTRAQEQIFNFCSEKRKGIFLGALSGLTPSAPGHSHQMIRDIPMIGSMPNLLILELYRREMNKNFKNLSLPKKGNLLKIHNNSNSDIIVICQGADILNEMLKIKNQLKSMKNVSILAAVWLNDINKREVLKLNNKKVLIFQSSTNFGSYDSFLSNKILSYNCRIKKFRVVSIKGVPACGKNEEVLDFHNLSSSKILNIIKKF